MFSENYSGIVYQKTYKAVGADFEEAKLLHFVYTIQNICYISDYNFFQLFK